MFYFQNLFNTALNGIDSGGATGGVVQVAQYILLAALMFGIFQAWAQGGDTQLLGVTGLRFFAMGLILVNYATVFRDVNGMFNTVANFIDTTTAGGVDVFAKWMNDIGGYWQNNGISSLWGLITGALASLLESILLSGRISTVSRSPMPCFHCSIRSTDRFSMSSDPSFWLCIPLQGLARWRALTS